MNAGSPASGKRGARFTVKFWGVRGSYPTVDGNTLAVGGNTACLEVNADGWHLIFDAGTGIIPLGKQLCGGSSPPPAYIFLSHTHIDHVMGLCFFEPLLTPQARSFILGPGPTPGGLTRSLRHLTHSHLFPVSLDELKGSKEVISLAGGQAVRFQTPGKRPRIDAEPRRNGIEPHELTVVTFMSPAHPLKGVMLYRVHFQQRSFVYATDIEQRSGGYPDIIEFIRGADLLIHDAQYLREEYESRAKPRKGWGHSTVDMAIDVAKKAGVKRLVLFHHEPTHDDNTMKRIEQQAQRQFPATTIAREGVEIALLEHADP